MIKTFAIATISKTSAVSTDIHLLIGKSFRIVPMTADQASRANSIEADIIIVDLASMQHEQIIEIGSALLRLRRPEQTVLVISNRDQRASLIAGKLMSGNNNIVRPLDDSNLGALLRAVTALLQLRASGRNRISKDAVGNAPEKVIAGVDAATDSLDAVFSIAAGNRTLNQNDIAQRSEAIVDAISSHGLKGWVDTVRAHHDATYQHCLLVTGTAVAFGRHVGFNGHDINRVTVGSLLHDVGKVVVPVSILEKPGKLTREEFEILKRHTTEGVRMLERAGPFDPEMLELVLSHHEYLDGSGYPNGLTAERIPDLVRLITIADIFAALVERRAYKPPMSNADAYKTLLSMKGKLDIPLVKAQKPVLLAA
jgi:putative nucleotidyltransferase with HDIG domain